MNDHHADQEHGAGRYEIRIAGQLDPRWAEWFDGLTLSYASGTTVLMGAIADQAALHGLLQRVRDLGLPLVSVTRLDDNRPMTPTTYPRKGL